MWHLHILKPIKEITNYHKNEMVLSKCTFYPISVKRIVLLSLLSEFLWPFFYAFLHIKLCLSEISSRRYDLGDTFLKLLDSQPRFVSDFPNLYMQCPNIDPDILEI